jgi:hypothetical protein
MQIGKLELKLHQWMTGSRDIARAAGPDAEACSSADHCPNDVRMLPHAEVIVGAPDYDLART